MTKSVSTSQELRDDVPANVAKLSEEFKNEFTVDHESGQAIFTPAFEAVALGEEFTPEQARKLNDRQVLLTNATYMAVGEASADAFKANSELQRVSGSVSIGSMTLDVDIAREASVRNVSTGEVSTVKNSGAAKLAFKKPTTRAHYKRVKSYLQGLGAETI